MSDAHASRVLKLEQITHDRLSKLDRRRTLILATLSPLEVHGPHLPLGQDLLEAYAIAEQSALRLAAAYPDWTIVLVPPVPVAADGVPKLGTIPFPVGLVRDVAYHLLAPFAQAGFTRLAISNFHGGPRHVCALEAAAELLSSRHEGVAACCLFSVVLSRLIEGDVFFEAVKDVPGREITTEQLKQDHHGAFVETSLALHLWPELVEEGWQDLPPSVAQEEVPAGENDSFLFGYEGQSGALDRARQTLAQVQSMFRSVHHFTHSSYFGYPALATAEQGEALFEHLVGLCTEATAEFLERGTDLQVHSPLWKLRHVLLNPGVNKLVDAWLERV